MIIFLPLLIAFIGLVMYLACTTNAKAAELGRIMFAMGLLAWLLQAEKVVGLLK